MSGRYLHLANRFDVADILKRLSDEYHQSNTADSCFWHNSTKIVHGYKHDRLFVLTEQADRRDDAEWTGQHKSVIGFLLGDARRGSLDILNIWPEHQRTGWGTFAFEQFRRLSARRSVPGVEVECAPASSEKFWHKLGFKELIPPHRCHGNRVLWTPVQRGRRSKCSGIPREVVMFIHRGEYPTLDRASLEYLLIEAYSDGQYLHLPKRRSFASRQLFQFLEFRLSEHDTRLIARDEFEQSGIRYLFPFYEIAKRVQLPPLNTEHVGAGVPHPADIEREKTR